MSNNNVLNDNNNNVLKDNNNDVWNNKNENTLISMQQERGKLKFWKRFIHGTKYYSNEKSYTSNVIMNYN